MAYQIDFTEQFYGTRRLRKIILRLVLVASVAGLAWGTYDAYMAYKRPTLDMKLADYEAVVRPIELMSAAWDKAAQEYGRLLRYYRLVWSANPTNFLAAQCGRDMPLLGPNYHPTRWTLKTGGVCTLGYRYVFGVGDKALQAKGIDDEIVRAVTSSVQVVGGKVEVNGVRTTNLIDVKELPLTVTFALPGAQAFPKKEALLDACGKEIAAVRKKVQDASIAKDAKGGPTTTKALMMAYLTSNFAKDKEGKARADFPEFASAIDIEGWFARADQFIARHRLPGDEGERRKLRERWRAVGRARLPWQRFRTLDNDELVHQVRELQSVSEGVRRFKVFLDQREADCNRKLKPLTGSYDLQKVHNEPLVKPYLTNSVSHVAGVSSVQAEFRDEPGVEPPTYVEGDAKYTFNWVRWTLRLGGAVRRNVREGAHNAASEADAPAEPLTVARLTECVCSVLKMPGPGFALESATVDFGADGDVAGAVLEGLVPVNTKECVQQTGGDRR